MDVHPVRTPRTAIFAHSRGEANFTRRTNAKPRQATSATKYCSGRKSAGYTPTAVADFTAGTMKP